MKSLKLIKIDFFLDEYLIIRSFDRYNSINSMEREREPTDDFDSFIINYSFAKLY